MVTVGSICILVKIVTRRTIKIETTSLNVHASDCEFRKLRYIGTQTVCFVLQIAAFQACRSFVKYEGVMMGHDTDSLVGLVTR